MPYHPRALTLGIASGLSLLLAAALTTAAQQPPATRPAAYEPVHNRYEPDLLIVGGSSSGTAAAVTAGRLGVPTLWTLRSPRDMGGLSTNAINPDSDLPIRYIGGLAMEYDLVARHTTGLNVGGGKNGEGYFAPFHVLFDYTRKQIDALPSITVAANLVPIAVEKDPTSQRVSSVTFAHRLQPGRRVVVRPKVTIDAEIEGDVAHLAGVSMTLLREGRVKSDDPSRNEESYAGRIYTPAKPVATFAVSGGKPMEGSTFEADRAAATMGWNGSLPVKNYGKGDANSPWVIKGPPPGYDPGAFAWWTRNWGGIHMGFGNHRWNMDEFLSNVEGWRMPDGRHVLESMDVRDREANERAHLLQELRALYHLQHVKRQFNMGLSDRDFHEGLPPKYTLADLGVSTNAGDAPLPGLIYMREGRRMVNDHVFGGRQIEDDGSGRFVQKRGWHARSAYFNAMLVDIHGVHRERRPGSGPEGMQLLRLVGHHNFGAPCVPFDVFVPRPSEATGLLVSSAGAYTHQAYAAFPRMETGRLAQGHACAVAAHLALKEHVPVHKVDVRKVQIANLRLHGQSIAYFADTIPGTHWHLVDQMLGARRVPERNDAGTFQREDVVTSAEVFHLIANLFDEHADVPVDESRLDDAVSALPEEKKAIVTRGQAIRALTAAAGLAKGKPAAGPFADVAADSELAAALSTWVGKGWIAADASRTFRPDDPIPFSELKRHAYHALFGDVAPDTVRPVDYRPVLVHDTFNRPDGPFAAPAGRWPAKGDLSWRITDGQLRATPPFDRTVYLSADAGTPDVDASVDVFLEQTLKPAAAGLAIGTADRSTLHRFLVQTDGPALRLRTDTLRDGKPTAEAEEVRVTHRRGLTLRIVTSGDAFAVYLDGALVRRETRPAIPGGTFVGLLNGGGEGSRFDNFEVRGK